LKKRGKITIWTIVIIAIVMVVGIIFFPRQSSLTNSESSGLPPVYLEYEVKSDGVGDSIEVVGNITAEIESVIPKVSGEIVEVYVEKGDVVEEGQILAKIDDLDYQIAYLNALNDYESSTNVGERMKEVKRLQLEKAKKNLEETEIKSPVSGIVNTVNISKGDMVGTSSGILTIVDRSTIKVETAVDEIDFPLINEGMDATIRIDPLNLEESGKITWISPTTQTDMGVVVIPIEIEFTQNNAQNLLTPGITADVEIVTLRLENTVAVPKDAIHEGTNGTKIVYKKTSEGGMEPVQVQTGKESDSMVEITQGLKPGDKVLILPSQEEAQRIMQNYGIPMGIPMAPGTVPQGPGGGTGRGGF
jgi:multidrug efflux pump subunit AcrA (membrane-fusion protein)